MPSASNLPAWAKSKYPDHEDLVINVKESIKNAQLVPTKDFIIFAIDTIISKNYIWSGFETEYQIALLEEFFVQNWCKEKFPAKINEVPKSCTEVYKWAKTTYPEEYLSVVLDCFANIFEKEYNWGEVSDKAKIVKQINLLYDLPKGATVNAAEIPDIDEGPKKEIRTLPSDMSYLPIEAASVLRKIDDEAFTTPLFNNLTHIGMIKQFRKARILVWLNKNGKL